MQILVINYAMNCVQIISDGRRYTCPMKEMGGELFFKFKNQLHKVSEYTSEYTSEFK